MAAYGPPNVAPNDVQHVRVYELKLSPFLKDQRAADEIQRKKKMIARHVFFHRSITKAGALGHWADKGISADGFYHAWRQARTAAGYPGSIPHDFRPTAVRNKGPGRHSGGAGPGN